MSTNDFNKTARLDISIQISGSGKFSPLQTGYGTMMDWTISGSMTKTPKESTETIKQQTCGQGIVPTEPAYFLSFGAQGSTGNTSGTIDVGALPPRNPAFLDSKPLQGTWLVNTKPVLSADGKVDGNDAGGYYIVKRPVSVIKVDDPIAIDPPIDNLTRVYEGDIVYVAGGKWNVRPQYRFPKPDRTFFWTPNEDPVLASGGLVDGKRALPGTIMLADSNYYIAKQSDGFDGMQYFYEGQGVLFDGQVWSKQLADPLVYEKENGSNEFRNLNVAYQSLQLHEFLLEQDHQNKGQVLGYQPINYETPITFTVTPPPPEPGGDPGTPYTIDFYFYWLSPQLGIADNALPPNIRYDFGDAWSKYYLANFEWLKARPKIGGSFIGAGFVLKSKPQAGQEEDVLFLSIDALEDGNITTITEKGADPDGNELINTFTITTTLTPSQG
jgi:hypothetical protein